MAEPKSPTPSGGNDADTNLRAVAAAIEPMLDDDGHYNPGGKASRALDPDSYEGEQPRGEDGRFVKQAAESDDAVTEPDVEVEDDLDAAGDVEDEDTEETGDTDEQLADSAVEEPDSDSTETDEPIRTVAELAEALGMTREAFLESITDTFGAAGDEVTVTLAEQNKGYQKDADYRRGTQQLAEAKQQAEQQYTEQMQFFEQNHRALAQHLQASERVIAAKLEDPALQRLRDTDPAEWTARNTEIARDLEQIRGVRAQAAQEYQNGKLHYEAQLKERETGRLRELIPDFGEGHKSDARGIMQSIGYSDQEIAQVYDHRIFMAALELKSLRDENAALKAEQAKAADTVKRVKKEIPKLTKPGKKRIASPTGIKRDQLSRLQKRAAKSGNLKDAAAVIEQMMQ